MTGCFFHLPSEITEIHYLELPHPQYQYRQIKMQVCSCFMKPLLINTSIVFTSWKTRVTHGTSEIFHGDFRGEAFWPSPWAPSITRGTFPAMNFPGFLALMSRKLKETATCPKRQRFNQPNVQRSFFLFDRLARVGWCRKKTKKRGGCNCENWWVVVSFFWGAPCLNSGFSEWYTS